MDAKTILKLAADIGIDAENAKLPIPTVANYLPLPDVLAYMGVRPARPRRPQNYDLMGGPVTGGQLGNGPGAGSSIGGFGGGNQTQGLKV